MHARRTWLASLVALALMGASTNALAAPTAKEKQEAKQLVTEAKKALKAGSVDDAVASLRKADALDPSAQTKVELAGALVQNKKLIEATQLLRAAIELGQSGAWAEKKAAETAQATLKELEPKIPWLAVKVDGPPAGTAKLTVDGKDFELDNESPVDPGEHTVAAEAEGFERAEKRVDVKEGAHESATLTLTKIASSAPPPPPSEEGDILPAAIAFGVGGVGVVVGSIFGVMALTQTSDVQDACGSDNKCPKSEADALDSAKTSGTISTIGFVVGGVGVATGVVLLVLGGDAPASATVQTGAGLELTPWVGVGEAGVVGRF